MKKSILFIFLALCTTLIFAQDSKIKAKEGWSNKGHIIFLFSQFAFSNWVTGGENNVAGNLSLDYDFNFAKKNITWDTKMMAAYGLIKSKNVEFAKKTDDRFELNSVIGKKASKNWYYSAFVNFQTQFTMGYIYKKDANGKEIRIEHTNFMSPAVLAFGPGMQWKKSNELKINIAPATSKLTLVDTNFTLPNNAYFGVEEGKNNKYELGFSAAGYGKFTIMENVTMENILIFFSDYLESPQNIDIDYTVNFSMKVNNHLTTKFTFQTIYNNNAFRGFQIRELFGLGFNYSF